MTYRLGVDVGGTFTDLLLVNEETGELARVKTPSTPGDPSQGVLAGIQRILEEHGVLPQSISHLMHGTTVATNAVLEGKGPRVGLITTQGFRQILHLARSQTPGPLAGWIIMIKPDPPAALEDTREIKERMSAQGEVVQPLDGQQVKKTVQDLVESGVESLTVSLINSFANPSHEREIKKIIQEIYPGFPVTISSDVLPEIREYERTLTACMNSYVRPKVEGYIGSLEKALGEMDMRGEFNILRSDAGLMTTDLTKENPIYAVLSGPAGGVLPALCSSPSERATRTSSPSIWEEHQPTWHFAKRVRRRSHAKPNWVISGSRFPASTFTPWGQEGDRSPMCRRSPKPCAWDLSRQVRTRGRLVMEKGEQSRP